ncbi:MAG TPA: M1 family metallopeptidase [Robiginitalea sp.]|nr:M1 family metallopeptidase [Robiginitalea sp.]
MEYFRSRLFKTLCILVAMLAHSGLSALTDAYPKNTKIDILNYTFAIALSDATDEIRCQVTVDLRFKEKDVRQLRLDLIQAAAALGNKGMTVTGVVSGGKELAFTHQNDELLISFGTGSEANQRSQVTISYHGIPAQGLHIGENKYGDRSFFSDNWPDRARHWLATVDHPYDKATCEFIVTAPARYQVVSNGLKKEETNVGNGLKRTHWKQSVPIASWLYVLGVAEFAVQYVDEFEGKSIQTWVFKQDRDAGFYDFAVPTRQVLEFYSDYIGPYSYEKLANIQSNSVSGGMEAASAIFYSSDAVTGDRSLRWRNVVIHEIAHQWFGNAVTEYDWDDVWLSEGFATYFTLLFIEHAYGRDAFLEGLRSSQKSVDAFHEKNPDYTIVHTNLADMSQVTSSQTYQKGSWVLHMLRGVVGTGVFWEGIRAYYREFKDGNATTADFQRVMEEVSGKDLGVFFRQWLYEPGALELEGHWRYDAQAGRVVVELTQAQPGARLFDMPIELEITYRDGSRSLERIRISEKVNRFEIRVDSEPGHIALDPNLWVLMQASLQRR